MCIKGCDNIARFLCILKNRWGCHTKTCTLMFVAVLFITASKMLFSRWWINKLVHRTMEYSSAIEMSYPATKRHGRTLNGNYLEKVMCEVHMMSNRLQLYDILEKAKLQRQGKHQGLPGGWGGGEDRGERVKHGTFGAVKLLCPRQMEHTRRMYLSKPTEHTAQEWPLTCLSVSE